MSKLTKTTVIQIVAYAYAELRPYGVRITAAGGNSNSVYIALGSKLGHMRISDHRGRRYRWNIIVGGVDDRRKRNDFASEKTYKAFIDHIKGRLIERAD